MVAEEIIYTQEVQTAVDTALDLHGQFYYQLNFQHNGSPQETDAPAQGRGPGLQWPVDTALKTCTDILLPTKPPVQSLTSGDSSSRPKLRLADLHLQVAPLKTRPSTKLPCFLLKWEQCHVE